MQDKRRRTRVDFRARADIQTTGARITNIETRDLSHKGMFVMGATPLKAGQGCYVTVHLVGEGDEGVSLGMEAKVVRNTGDGAAIDFVAMSPETYMHLRNLVILNSDDPEAAEKEFTKPAFDASSEDG